MNQLSFFGPPTWSVTEITRYVRELLESDDQLQDVWIAGEVSNRSRPQSGHLYFTLKDSSCALKVVMWRTQVQRQAYLPAEGEAVEVRGAISVYDSAGQYQLYANLIRPAGEGKLYQEFLRLKARLEAEGLFAEERKRPIPEWPQKIGIITSPTGAALRDMLNTLARRYPLPEVVLAPTSVQGFGAPGEIIAAFERLGRCQPDVILLARGGGSIEDLWAFNDEGVARAVAACGCPVICGVGHETDFTIADFVADLRAPTPTAAAELATPDIADLEFDLGELAARLGRWMAVRLEDQRDELDHLGRRLLLRSPQALVRSGRQRMDDLARRAELALKHQQRIQSSRLLNLEQRLAALNPLAVLRRGYAVVSRPDGAVIRSAGQVQPGDPLVVRVEDGSFPARAGES
jgi:exodeoxyribonuclease VII large subunit